MYAKIENDCRHNADNLCRVIDDFRLTIDEKAAAAISVFEQHQLHALKILHRESVQLAREIASQNTIPANKNKELGYLTRYVQLATQVCKGRLDASEAMSLAGLETQINSHVDGSEKNNSAFQSSKTKESWAWFGLIFVLVLIFIAMVAAIIATQGMTILPLVGALPLLSVGMLGGWACFNFAENNTVKRAELMAPQYGLHGFFKAVKAMAQQPDRGRGAEQRTPTNA